MDDDIELLLIAAAVVGGLYFLSQMSNNVAYATSPQGQAASIGQSVSNFVDNLSSVA